MSRLGLGCIVALIWQTRNNIIFNQAGFDWEIVLQEIEILSWNILRTQSKEFNSDLNKWCLNPLVDPEIFKF
jgi:hypothetical protein